MLLFLIACNDGTLNTKNINATPEATIILPDSNDGGDVEGQSEVLFRAVLTDADQDDLPLLEARWRVDSNPEPICDYASPNGDGETDCTIRIEEDMQKIIVEVRDGQNAVGSDDYLLNVFLTDPPEIELISPISEGQYLEGISISFEALVSDTEDANEELLVSWRSDISGDLEIGGTVSPLGFVSSEGYLVEGTHLITATVVDTTDKSNSADVEIVVGPASTPTILYVDIQNTGGSSLDEAFNGQTIVCDADASDPENDPLFWSFQWINPAGDDITIDSTTNTFTLDYASQNLSPGDLLTCTATVSDGQTSVESNDTVLLVDCSPFATEIPHDGIDSNCDGLETLNDLDGNGQPDDTTINFGSDPNEPARLGVECLGEAMSTSTGTVYFLLCDDDHYWKGAHDFCSENGYDSLATLESDAEFQFASNLLLSSINDYQNADGSNRSGSIWVGLTRGPDCSPVGNTNLGYNSVCGTGISNYYWIDNAPSSWLNSSYWIGGEGSNSVEHCAILVNYQGSGNVGLYDLYCDNVASSPHNQWSVSHNRPSMCVKRQ